MKNLFTILFSAVVVLLATSATFAQTTTSKPVSEPEKNTNTVVPKTADKNSAVSGVDKKYIVIAPNGDELIMIAAPEEDKSAGDTSKLKEKQTPVKKEKEEPK